MDRMYSETEPLVAANQIMEDHAIQKNDAETGNE